MVDRLRRAPQSVGVSLDGNQRIFGIRRIADRPVGVHGNTARLEECRRRRVRDAGAATAGLGEVDRITRSGRVEFGLGRQTVLLKPGAIPATDARDERLRRHRCRAAGDDLLQFIDRLRHLDVAHPVTGVDAEADEVDVRIVEPWDDGRPFQIDHLTGVIPPVGSDRRDSSVGDRD
jgi:hypothetical protein